MYRWLAAIFLMGALSSSMAASAQTPIGFSSLQIQLWPEYDQPSMLVISDFKLPDDAKLPVGVAFQFPKEGSLVAVASQAADGSLLNTDYQGPTTSDAGQTISIQIQSPAIYHVEYYQPLSRSGAVRSFAYVWPGAYAVDDLTISVRLPPDATDVSSDPVMQSSQSSDGTPYLRKDFGALTAGQQLPLQLTYTRISNSTTASQQDLRSSEPLGAATQGRVMLSNYLPYVAGVLGVALIAGGIIYFWQSSRGRALVRERRHRRAASEEGQPASEVYCHQCGTRAYAGDRFCRVCGTRLRQPE